MFRGNGDLLRLKIRERGVKGKVVKYRMSQNQKSKFAFRRLNEQLSSNVTWCRRQIISKWNLKSVLIILSREIIRFLEIGIFHCFICLVFETQNKNLLYVCSVSIVPIFLTCIRNYLNILKIFINSFAFIPIQLC